jgi:hypothetical protein
VTTSRSLFARTRYRFDNALSRGPFVVIAYLAALSMLIVVATALVATALSLSFGNGEHSSSFIESAWQAMLRTIDAAALAEDATWRARVLGLVVTVGGIFLAGSLIGLIANAVDRRVEQLRRGRSAVIERDHTLILGWSPQVPRIIAELVVANESDKRASVGSSAVAVIPPFPPISNGHVFLRPARSWSSVMRMAMPAL